MPRVRKPLTARKSTVLRPVHPNKGIELAYKRKLDALVEELHKSVMYWVLSAYRNNEPVIMANDATPADILAKAIKKMTDRWVNKFDDMANKMGDFFAQAVAKQSSATMAKILKDAGWTVEFRMTPAMKDVAAATVNANVALIKSIPAQYLGKVEGMVMRSVQTGRDLHSLSKDLEKELGVTKRRAAFIARDQNSKATAAFNKARTLELGLEDAMWVHSAGGRTPRPSHVKAGRDKVTYKISQGWFDPDVKEYIQPGELINCRCIGRAIVKGFS